MSDFSVISKERLQPILEAFGTVEWPLNPQTFNEMAGALGWDLRRQSEYGIRLSSGLGVNIDRVNGLLSDGYVTEVELALTDTLQSEGSPEVRECFKELSETVADLLGQVGTVQRGSNRIYWELSSGGRLDLANLGNKVLLTLLSERYARVERAEQRQRLDPNVPIAEHQESQR